MHTFKECLAFNVFFHITSNFLQADMNHINNSLPVFTSASWGNLQTKITNHSVNTTANLSCISQEKLAGSVRKAVCFISYKHQGREEEHPTKNRWVSTERDDGPAMGAICDWSIGIPSKPFFSCCHVQRVDKRHHPTDSLINCEIYSYLPLPYSRGPKNRFSTCLL